MRHATACSPTQRRGSTSGVRPVRCSAVPGRSTRRGVSARSGARSPPNVAITRGAKRRRVHCLVGRPLAVAQCDGLADNGGLRLLHWLEPRSCSHSMADNVKFKEPASSSIRALIEAAGAPQRLLDLLLPTSVARSRSGSRALPARWSPRLPRHPRPKEVARARS